MGTPEEIVQKKVSLTGQYLSKVLARDTEYALTS
jgi:excinuclease UvrABC ATPase subunit